MREDLLGYLLGALEPEEVRRVEALLESDPEARAELKRLQAAMRSLDEERASESPADFEPPADLIGRTMDFIEASKPQPAETPSVAPVNPLSETGLSQRGATTRRWRIPDALVATISMIALGGLMFPAILEGRFEARRVQCQSNLQELGTSLAQFAINDPQQRLPEIDLRGPLAFAGVFSVELKEHDLLDRENAIWCPSQNPPASMATVPTKLQLQEASSAHLLQLQNVSGGQLAYTLGVMDDQSYGAPHYESRSTFAILADAPIRTANGTQLAHDGRGFNLLYEDGRVRFVSSTAVLETQDQPYVNFDNRVEAGLNVNDASLGESGRAPFVWVKQSL
ncbi:hypothetical protein Poly24_34660 [Rosistilla carotiformis]|uniref:Zinc-finger domain-containing protein n=1 Tax=Rosistilla carotiformis TaxID=2528017 RepID=A0A518JW32_9BACT|nr:hypothetical protein [Rosistilla carotiformis]QDV69749.1 hypothetical protein Poly24_34660 [Rosistilla carotiformis]